MPKLRDDVNFGLQHWFIVEQEEDRWASQGSSLEVRVLLRVWRESSYGFWVKNRSTRYLARDGKVGDRCRFGDTIGDLRIFIMKERFSIRFSREKKRLPYLRYGVYDTRSSNYRAGLGESVRACVKRFPSE